MLYYICINVSSRRRGLFKVDNENGIVNPFTYVGKGKLSNCRKTDNSNGTYLFDISMENELPDYLQYDFGLTK